MHVIVEFSCGRVKRLLGPFASEQEAIDYSDNVFHNLTWHVAPVVAPESDPNLICGEGAAKAIRERLRNRFAHIAKEA